MHEQELRPVGVEQQSTPTDVTGFKPGLGAADQVGQLAALGVVKRQAIHADIVDLHPPGAHQIKSHPERLKSIRRKVVDLEHKLRPGLAKRPPAGQPTHRRESVILALAVDTLHRQPAPAARPPH